MFRKIYETIQVDKDKQKHLVTGDLAIFENIELKQRNIDDTVMVLNILQDSNLKNESDDSIEINLNKMMDKMLDDFTIVIYLPVIELVMIIKILLFDYHTNSMIILKMDISTMICN